ncbi:glycerophosphodiester phosphodiesterase [Pasteurellaceae bacterium USgator11]|nr:glycerophosphodiester phosphodiesterase [Pasteurellaceae bacterium USgator41]TNG95672.1 glycerophosphodiester phosphodiesterase [Pasteurellaceae bacterium UScroc31]TNG95973.1 glycerophosphodiester phosphodiesterase [Pasteurellaceae bacterium UScroc12]TNH00184.1 glycerophosphodiester phosphodiesterase [Pasteurellaceae bacterium USgator11]
MGFNFTVAEQGVVLANSHRGYSMCYPENTMPAFEAALVAGTHTVELDVHMTSDEKIVVLHDFTIDRVSTGKGHVELMTLAELKQYDYGVKFAPEFAGTPIPELREVLLWAVANGVGLVVEAKQKLHQQRFAEVLAALLKETNAVDNVLLLAFDHVMINHVKRLLPEVRLQVVTLARYQNQLAATLGSNADSACVEYHYIHRDDLMAYKQAGLSVRLYLHESPKGKTITQAYNQKYGYDVESEIIGWLRDGLIDMLSHDDILYLVELIEKAGKRYY